MLSLPSVDLVYVDFQQNVFQAPVGSCGPDAEEWEGCWHSSVVRWGADSHEWLLQGAAPSR